MNKAAVVSLLLGIAVWSAVLIGTFNHSLPNWCAHPEGNGNWVVQPLCK